MACGKHLTHHENCSGCRGQNFQRNANNEFNVNDRMREDRKRDYERARDRANSKAWEEDQKAADREDKRLENEAAQERQRLLELTPEWQAEQARLKAEKAQRALEDEALKTKLSQERVREFNAFCTTHAIDPESYRLPTAAESRSAGFLAGITTVVILLAVLLIPLLQYVVGFAMLYVLAVGPINRAVKAGISHLARFQVPEVIVGGLMIPMLFAGGDIAGQVSGSPLHFALLALGSLPFGFAVHMIGNTVYQMTPLEIVDTDSEKKFRFPWTWVRP